MKFPTRSLTQAVATVGAMSFVALFMLAAAVSVQAQDSSSTQGSGTRADRGARFRERAGQRFEAADSNHDGKISPDEARAGMPRVSEHFAEIDANKDGFVSRDEIAAFMQARMAERRAGAAQ
jgi:hypothetical protein